MSRLPDWPSGPVGSVTKNSIQIGDFRGAAALIGASVSASLASVYTAQVGDVVV